MPAPSVATVAPEAPPRPTSIRVSLVGTNDLHGHIGSLPIFAGYLRNLRAARERDGGRVVLLDGGDLFQGTLESNLNEGAAVIDGYNALHYDAVAIGNHEFDFGPVGERATPHDASDNPRGALFARMAEAHFPFLSSNIVEAGTGGTPQTINFQRSVMLDEGGVKIGVVGLSTESTPHTTIAANFRGLEARPLEASLIAEAQRLRSEGAQLIFVTAHAGGSCHEFRDPHDVSTCDAHDEIFELLNALPPGTVQAVVAGHTHAGIAHFVNGVPVIESMSAGVAFGRVDFVLNSATGAVEDVQVSPPMHLCNTGEHPRACAETTYEGAPVVPDTSLEQVFAPRFEAAMELRHRPLGVTLASEFRRSYDSESPLGNLLADWMLSARPGSDVAFVNGGGIRANLPAGLLSYGALYETFPFDNRFAVVELTGAQLRRILRDNLQSSGSILSVAGVNVRATCQGHELSLEITRTRGGVVRDNETLHLLTSDFLATGGDRALAAEVRAESIQVVDEGDNIRDGIANYLTAHPATVRPDDPHIFGDRPRWQFSGSRPLRCTR